MKGASRYGLSTCVATSSLQVHRFWMSGRSETTRPLQWQQAGNHAPPRCMIPLHRNASRHAKMITVATKGEEGRGRYNWRINERMSNLATLCSLKRTCPQEIQKVKKGERKKHSEQTARRNTSASASRGGRNNQPLGPYETEWKIIRVASPE